MQMHSLRAVWFLDVCNISPWACTIWTVKPLSSFCHLLALRTFWFLHFALNHTWLNTHTLDLFTPLLKSKGSSRIYTCVILIHLLSNRCASKCSWTNIQLLNIACNISKTTIWINAFVSMHVAIFRIALWKGPLHKATLIQWLYLLAFLACFDNRPKPCNTHNQLLQRRCFFVSGATKMLLHYTTLHFCIRVRKMKRACNNYNSVIAWLLPLFFLWTAAQISSELNYHDPCF